MRAPETNRIHARVKGRDTSRNDAYMLTPGLPCRELFVARSCGFTAIEKNVHRAAIHRLTRRVTGHIPSRMTTAHERKQQERHARRRKIQRAARTVFAEKGYAKTSIEQIAREASLSVGAIYLYFRSKEDLYISLLEETLELFDTELGAIRARAESNPAEGLKSAWNFLAQWATSDVEATRVLRLISQPNIRKQLSDEVAEAIAAGIARVREHIGAVVEGGVSSGRWHAGDTSETVDLFWALLLGSLQASDAKANLDLPGGNLADLSRNSLSALLATLGEREAVAAHAA